MSIQKEVILAVANKYGMHARASTRFAQIAQKFAACVYVRRESKSSDGNVVISEEVDAKSVLGLLSLGAECGDRVHERVSGDDAEKAMKELRDLVEQKFHEDQGQE